MITLIQGGHLYGPEDLGTKDLLAINGKIERIADEIKLSDGAFRGAEIVPAKGKLVFPGFIDQHVHTIGGGGSGGPLTRVKEVYFRDVVKSGITTLVGTLGTDTVSRSLETLLVKAKALNLSGLNSFIYTGSFPTADPYGLGGKGHRPDIRSGRVEGGARGNGVRPARSPGVGESIHRSETGRFAQREERRGPRAYGRLGPGMDSNH